MADLQPCLYCGETDPFPRWLCLRKPPFGSPDTTPVKGGCDHSIESMERFSEQVNLVNTKRFGRKELGSE